MIKHKNASCFIVLLDVVIALNNWSFIACAVQVQPVAELVELSRRWCSDGRQIQLNEVIAKGGSLRRTGSLRHGGAAKVSITKIEQFY